MLLGINLFANNPYDTEDSLWLLALSLENKIGYMTFI